MEGEKHFIEKKIWFSKWYKWIAVGLFIILMLCVLPKCCSHDFVGRNHNTTPNTDTISFHIDPHKRRIIDPDRIEPLKDDPLNRRVVSDLVNVYLKDTVEIKKFYAETKNRLSNYNLTTTDTAEVYKRIQFKVDISDKENIMIALRQDSINVKFVTNEWVYQRTITHSTSDPGYKDPKNSWFYEKIGVFDAWNYTKGNSSVKIAVLDDGFDLNHKELKNKYTNPWNVVHYNDVVYANTHDLYHGTHVAGSIIGEAGNSFGISGVAPNCTFIPVQISYESGIITISSLLDGIFYALKNKADIINLSIAMTMGQTSKSLNKNQQLFIRNHYLLDEEKLWDEVFEIAKNSNTIIVQAAGNDNVMAGIDPMKRSGNSIIVGALNPNLDLTAFTNYGADVDVYAPGFQIYSSLPNNNMGYLDGTSMASPIVAGSIALIKSHRPNLAAEEIIKLIRTSSSKNTNQFLDLGLIFNDLL